MGKMKLLKQVLEDLNNLNQSMSELVNAVEFDEDHNHIDEDQKVIDIRLEQVRGVLAEKSRDGFTKEVKSLIQSFGANRLSDVKESDYPSLLEKAKEITCD